MKMLLQVYQDIYIDTLYNRIRLRHPSVLDVQHIVHQSWTREEAQLLFEQLMD